MRKGLFDDFLELIRILWQAETEDPSERPNNTPLEAIVTGLITQSFQFSPMYRSWLPKEKPGELRPITQPEKRDILVLDSLSILLNLAYQEKWGRNYHGYIPGTGHLTFSHYFTNWGELNRLLNEDIVKSIDSIYREDLLYSFLQTDLGPRNFYLCELVRAFLKTPILDSKGYDYSNQEKGIPQGSSLSPVLMNIYLHRLDEEIDYLMQKDNDTNLRVFKKRLAKLKEKFALEFKEFQGIKPPK